MKQHTNTRLNMVTSVTGVLTKHNDTWKDHVAFTEGVTEVTANLENLEDLTQVILGNSGTGRAQPLASVALNVAANEIMGAVATYAADIADAELAAKVTYALSGVTKGIASEVVARCKTIHATATENLAALGKYGVTAAKLTALKKKIDAFDKLKVAPRDSIVTRRAAGELQTQLLRATTTLLREKLDRLVVQFKEANPTFYEEYYAARVVVDRRGGSAENRDVQPTPIGTPAPAPTPAHA